MPATIRDKIKITFTWDKGAAPGIVYLGNSNLPPELIEQLSLAILEFAQHSPEGIAMMNNTGYEGLARMGADEMKLLEPYGNLLKKANTTEH